MAMRRRARNTFDHSARRLTNSNAVCTGLPLTSACGDKVRRTLRPVIPDLGPSHGRRLVHGPASEAKAGGASPSSFGFRP